MPSLSSIADVRVDAEKLLSAVEANTELLQDAAPVTAPLVASLTRLKDLTTRRDTLKVDSQVLSKDIQATLREIRDGSAALRALITSKLGVRSEKLREFRVPVLRLGVRRKKGSTTPEPVAPPAQPAPDAPGTE
jgi:hypothetical protein